MAVENRATLDEVREATAVAARAAWSKGGAGTIILSVGKVLAITDAFVITSGSNPRMVRTIAEEVEKKVKLASSRSPLAIEGLDDARWVLMDYGDFVVHVFIDEAREFYQFDRLWGDAGRWDWDPGDSGALASGE
ncbi:MAG TPA: ribosome silencing factor [Acidimicrobiales bacterium]